MVGSGSKVIRSGSLGPGFLFSGERRTWLRPEIRAAIKDIQDDRESGARELALATLRALSSVGADGECSGEELRATCRQLALARPMNASIENAVAAAWSRFLDTNDCLRAVDETIEEIEMGARGAGPRRAKGDPLRHGDDPQLVLYSHRAPGLVKPRRAIVTEARPFNEGVARRQGAGPRRHLDDADHGGPDGAVRARGRTRSSSAPTPSCRKATSSTRSAPAGSPWPPEDAEVPFYSVAETLKVAAPSEPCRSPPEEGKATEICDREVAGGAQRLLRGDSRQARDVLCHGARPAGPGRRPALLNRGGAPLAGADGRARTLVPPSGPVRGSSSRGADRPSGSGFRA